MSKHPPNGFTLIELLVVMGLLGVALGALVSVVVSANKARAAQELVVTMQQNVRAASDFLNRELRSSTIITCMENTTNPCPTGGDKVAFGSVNDAQTRIFSWSGTDNILRFSVSAGVPDRQPLADSITGITLTPYDVNNAVTPNIASIKRIDITITGRTANPLPNTNAYDTYSITTSAMKRN